jgi:hypothetical protein
MVAKAKHFPNPRPDHPPERLGSRRCFPAVSARVRASLVLRRQALEAIVVSGIQPHIRSVFPEPGRSAHARPAA